MNGPAFSSLNFCHPDLSCVCVSAMNTAAKRRFRASARTKSPVISYLSSTDWSSTTSEATYSLSSTGKIPEYDGYELVCRIRPIPDVVQMTLNDDGEVMA